MANHSLRTINLIALCVISTASHTVVAVPTIPDGEPAPYYKKVLEQFDVNPVLTPETTELLGEQIDLSSGAISFSNVDVAIPGNFQIPVEVRRSFSDSNIDSFKRGGFGDWNLDIPALHTTYISATRSVWNQASRCTSNQEPKPLDHTNFSNVMPDAFWNGVDVQIGGGSQKLLQGGFAGLPNRRYTTKSHHQIQCYRIDTGAIVQSSQVGVREGFKVTDTSGTSYYFEKFHSVKRIGDESRSYPIYDLYLLVSKVEDRFGNSVVYNYDTITGDNLNEMKRLTSIVASDGREIRFKYEGPANHLISSVEADNRVWRYTYKQVGLYYTLENVYLPSDGLKWSYDLAQFNFLDNYQAFTDFQAAQEGGTCQSRPNQRWTQTGTITHPYGTVGTFVLETAGHGRTGVPIAVDYSSVSLDTTCYLTQSIKSKTLSGPGLAAMRWDYRYSENSGSYTNEQRQQAPAELSGQTLGNYNLQDVKVTSVTAPDGSVTRNVFMRRFRDYLENSQIASLQYDTDGTTLLQKSVNEFQPSPTLIGSAFALNNRVNYDVQRVVALQTKTTIDRVGKTGGVDSYTTEYTNYNGYDGLTDKREWNSIQPSKVLYSKFAYQHAEALNLFNLPTSNAVSNDNVNFVTVAATDYVPANGSGAYLPYKQYSNGRLVQTNSYYANGLLQRTEYGTGRFWLNFADYKRGKAQTIRLPQRYSTGEIKLSNSINDSGTVASSMDLNGNVTNYRYDLLGRVTAIDPADSRWSDTSISYSSDSQNRVLQQLYKGNYRKTVTMDALLRPILSKEWDAANEAGTVKYVNQQFNAYNKATFSSVPSSNSAESFGSSTTYDGLQRVVRQTNTANGDVSTSYEVGNIIKTTNGRNYTTSTSYLAFGSPATELVSRIVQPEGVDTSIDYNLLNLPISISQGGITELRRYNTTGEVCLIKRPETGIKVMTYNALGQVDSFAEGLTGAGTSCQDYSNDANAWVRMEYDNLGAVAKQTFSDGTPTKSVELDNQGNIKVLKNGAVEWNYDYNTANLPESERLTLDSKTFVIGHAYNALGQAHQLTYPGGLVIDYGINAMGDIESVKQGTQVLASGVKYHANGQLELFNYGNGLRFEQRLDDKKRPYQRNVHTSYFSPLLQQTYSYDAANNIETIVDPLNSNRTLGLTYDGLNRLKTASSGLFGQLGYSYDTLGNIKTKSVFSTTHVYNYDASTNRLSSLPGYQFSYDSRGNVTSNGQRAFSFNRANQLTSSAGVSYVYDGHGRRVKQLKSNQNTYSLYDLSGTLLYRGNPETNHTNTVYLGNQLLAELDSGGAEPPPAKPTINLSLTSQLITSTCPKPLGCVPVKTSYIYYSWSTSNASSCQGTFSQTTPTGTPISSSAVSGIRQNSTTQTFPVSDALFTLTLTCQGPGGTTTDSRTIAGTGSNGEEM